MKTIEQPKRSKAPTAGDWKEYRAALEKGGEIPDGLLDRMGLDDRHVTWHKTVLSEAARLRKESDSLEGEKKALEKLKTAVKEALDAYVKARFAARDAEAARDAAAGRVRDLDTTRQTLLGLQGKFPDLLGVPSDPPAFRFSPTAALQNAAHELGLVEELTRLWG